LVRFRKFCRFEPETGCVVWIGGTTAGRGHHVRYGSFWFDGRRWFAHRWAGKFIHGLDIDQLQGDHFCPHIPHPNTLCVEHVQPKTLLENRELQAVRAFEARKTAIHLQVGVLRYDDVYGEAIPPPTDLIPFFNPPAWLGADHGNDNRSRLGDCPF
jgi:hypothetical protein